jgi:hypothetical protein
MRAVEGSLGHSFKGGCRKQKGPRPRKRESQGEGSVSADSGWKGEITAGAGGETFGLLGNPARRFCLRNALTVLTLAGLSR